MMMNFMALVTRILIGFIFVQSGWGKFQHLDKVVEFFNSLQIPMANLQAPFVAGVEFIGGLCLITGIAARWAAIPLMVTMLVAIRTAKWEEIDGFSALLTNSEFLIFLLLAWIALVGPGKYILKK